MVDRRKFLKLGVAATSAPLLAAHPALAEDETPMRKAGEDYSPLSGTKFKSIPSICGQCPSRCAILGYLDGDRLTKIEGQPKSIRNEGKVCAKGQGGASRIYDPDRILYPLRRTGKRGEGKWERISWDEALTDLAARLGKIRKEGRPENFVFHHGWISVSADKLITEAFLPAYGTASIVRQTCHHQSARKTALELTWGSSLDSWDFDRTAFVLNFGSNVLEAETNFVSLAHRLALATVDHRIKMVTFDIRLSNTAAKSTQWVPVKPGTDLAVALAMSQVVMSEDLYRGAGEDFLDFCLVTPDRTASTADKIAALKAHLAQYTPEWAEKISGVPAEEIKKIAREFATTKPACLISSRGAGAHYNGVETERAIQMLAAITGNIDNPGGRCEAVTPEWKYPTGPKKKPVSRKLKVFQDLPGKAVLPQFGSGQMVLEAIKESGERPEVYMWYNHNPAYANPDVRGTVEILKDESLLPFTVAVTPLYDETAALADLILPDTTYLERYDFEHGVSPNQVPEYAIRQPLAKIQGEARDFKDVCCDLAERMGFPLGFKSGKEFVEAACNLTPVVKKKAGGFRRMKKRGVWHDKKAEPLYNAYRKRVSPERLMQDGVIFDESTGVYWNWKNAQIENEAKAVLAGYRGTPTAYKGYVGQKIGDAVYAGFDPGVLNKSGYFELYSPILAAKGLAALPTFVAIPEHAGITDDQLILTTFKVVVQTNSTTGNNAWLTEIQHNNPAWINPDAAAARGISDGDAIKVSSQLGEITATATVTPTVAPSVIAFPSHAGRWEGGRYACGKWAPFGIDDARHDDYIWWTSRGVHPNWIIAKDQEPVSGQQRWMDTVVKVVKIPHDSEIG